jgi:tetratricopeptide (TPR) repeat protein
MKRLARHAIIISSLACSGAALAAGGGGPDPSLRGWDSTPADPTVQAAQGRFAAQDWKGAQELLARALERSPQNADYHNLYAYAIRKGPAPNMDLVFRHYNEALRINPRHLGAHEYLGEAYLMQNNASKAKEHLAQLDRLCGRCDEFAMLRKAIEDFEQGQAKK